MSAIQCFVHIIPFTYIQTYIYTHTYTQEHNKTPQTPCAKAKMCICSKGNNAHLQPLCSKVVKAIDHWYTNNATQHHHLGTGGIVILFVGRRTDQLNDDTTCIPQQISWKHIGHRTLKPIRYQWHLLTDPSTDPAVPFARLLADRHTHTYTHTHTYIYIYIYIYIYTHTLTHTHTQTKKTHTHTHTHTRAHTHAHTHTHTPRQYG